MAQKPKTQDATPVDVETQDATPVDVETQDATPVDVDVPFDGCVFMYRDGERAQVNTASGSVEVMESLGWSQTKPKGVK